MGLIADLGDGAVAIDTSIFIYLIEEHPTFLPLIRPLFEQADAGKRELITSAVTLLEVLVGPFRARLHSCAPRPASRLPMRCNSCARSEQVARRF